MGVTKADCTFLFYGKSIGIDFDRTCMLGRLKLYMKVEEIKDFLLKYKNNSEEINKANFVDEYSEPLFNILGAANVDSIDISAYEKATIIHDLNTPISATLHNSFSCIIDGGTLEHVFNFPVAIKSCMEALKVGGHFIGISPANNQMGHGFYQFSPELYYRIFSEENGFRINKMLLSADSVSETQWYEVVDPKSVRSRVTVVNNYPLTLRFIAEKISHQNVFVSSPQQIDYVNVWNNFESQGVAKHKNKFEKLLNLYSRFLPYRLRVLFRNLYNLYKVEKVNTVDLGVINADHFKKVSI